MSLILHANHHRSSQNLVLAFATRHLSFKNNNYYDNLNRSFCQNQYNNNNLLQTMKKEWINFIDSFKIKDVKFNTSPNRIDYPNSHNQSDILNILDENESDFEDLEFSSHKLPDTNPIENKSITLSPATSMLLVQPDLSIGSRIWKNFLKKLRATYAFDIWQKYRTRKTIRKALAAHRLLTNRFKTFKKQFDQSQHPLLWQFRSVSDSVLAETETAKVISKLRKSIPDFTVSKFLNENEYNMIPNVIKAYLEGDVSSLKQFLSGQALAYSLQSILQRQESNEIWDNRILNIENIEFQGARFVNKRPILALSFQCQLVNCSRDRVTGEIKKGSEYELEWKFFHWLLRPSVKSPFNWKIIDMHVEGIAALI